MSELLLVLYMKLNSLTVPKKVLQLFHKPPQAEMKFSLVFFALSAGHHAQACDTTEAIEMDKVVNPGIHGGLGGSSGVRVSAPLTLLHQDSGDEAPGERSLSPAYLSSSTQLTPPPPTPNPSLLGREPAGILLCPQQYQQHELDHLDRGWRLVLRRGFVLVQGRD